MVRVIFRLLSLLVAAGLFLGALALAGVWLQGGISLGQDDPYADSPRKKGQTAFKARGMSKDQYIAYLKTTRPADSERLARRIQAVKDLPEWP